MAQMINRVASQRAAVAKASPAPRPALCPARVGRVVVRSSDAAAELEKFAAGVRTTLKDNDQSVVVTPLAAKSIDGSPTASVDGGLLELNKDTFWPYLKMQGDTLVVVDFYTDWCGPCKLMYPQLVALSQERTDVRFVKLNCNKTNKELGMQLQIRVAPTFHLYRNGVKVADMTGAKMDKLLDLINTHSPKK